MASRSETSRIAAVTNIPWSVGSSLRLISAGNRCPSRRSPVSFSPASIGRAAGSVK
jgi:hypothetical protein